MSDAPLFDGAPQLTLPETDRRLHRALMNSAIETGDVPRLITLASELGVKLDELRMHLRKLAEADYLGFDGAGRVICLYPFSIVPTSHIVNVDNVRRFAMCSLDALGMAAMLGRAVEIKTTCPICMSPIRLSVRPGVVINVDPAETVVVARRDDGDSAHKTCCGFTVFACGAVHAGELVSRTSDMAMLDLQAALAIGEALFAGFLGDILPARRTRPRLVSEGDPATRLNC